MSSSFADFLLRTLSPSDEDLFVIGPEIFHAGKAPLESDTESGFALINVAQAGRRAPALARG